MEEIWTCECSRAAQRRGESPIEVRPGRRAPEVHQTSDTWRGLAISAQLAAGFDELQSSAGSKDQIDTKVGKLSPLHRVPIFALEVPKPLNSHSKISCGLFFRCTIEHLLLFPTVPKFLASSDPLSVIPKEFLGRLEKGSRFREPQCA